MSLNPDYLHSLEKAISGEVRTDFISRILYSTDASIYQIEPLGVVLPRTPDDLAVIVEISAHYGVPILPRGSGSSLAGQAVGPAMIVDCSRYLDHILEIDPEKRTVTVEPGVILSALNRVVGEYNLQFGPDPASAERATLGGSIANNATGAHSIVYGMAADHMIEMEVVLADGSIAHLGEINMDQARIIASQNQPSILSNIYRVALNIRENNAEIIQRKWPRTWRCASGYTINYLLPWTASQPPMWGWGLGSSFHPSYEYPPARPGTINLAPLLAGSEGTLAVIRKAKLRLVPKPRYTILGVLPFPNLVEACEAIPDLLNHHPSAIELIPKELISLARSLPAYANLVSVLDPLSGKGGEPQTVLVVEFSGDQLEKLRIQAKGLGRGVFVAESTEAQKKIWAVRKVGLGILMSRPGDTKPFAFIEDLSVPVEKLGVFVREMQRILEEHGTVADIYAHASAGCLHIRPLLNLKSSHGKAALRSIAAAAVRLTIDLGGAISGEHGDGIARSEWLEQAFGKEIVTSFYELKNAADPNGILNPGKIVHPSAMDENLRFGKNYQAHGWQPAMDFAVYDTFIPKWETGKAEKSPHLNSAEGLIAAVEHCNGAGVCRKLEGVMCPSFQATREEMHSTRGRANLLRAMISGVFPTEKMAEKAVKEALDLCLACKGCKVECPSGVDMAKLKYEFQNHYYKAHRRRLRDYLFGYIGIVSRLGYPLAPLANRLLANPLVIRLGEYFFGLTSQRPFPHFAPRPLRKLIPESSLSPSPMRERVLFLSDAFTEYFYPQAGISAITVLKACGYQVDILPVIGAGRTLLSKGFLQAAKHQAEMVLDVVAKLDPDGCLPVVGVEPSEVYSLRDEYLDLFPGDEGRQRQARSLSQRAWMIDEFLIRPGSDGKSRLSHLIMKSDSEPASKSDAHSSLANAQVYLHGHCYQKAQPPADDGYSTGVAATVEMLTEMGFDVKLIETTCCGMAGAFGYEAEHYELSMRVGELGLFPAIREADPGVKIAASGVSCHAQITDGTQREVIHPITLVYQCLSTIEK